jgi:hypothetical protein
MASTRHSELLSSRRSGTAALACATPVSGMVMAFQRPGKADAEWQRGSQRRGFGFWPAIGAIQVLTQKFMLWRTISFAMAVCWRCSSAVQRPRMAPAQLLAALSQRLIQGLCIEVSFNGS